MVIDCSCFAFLCLHINPRVNIWLLQKLNKQTSKDRQNNKYIYIGQFKLEIDTFFFCCMW